MGDTARTRRIEVTPGDFVELVELEEKRPRREIADIIYTLEGGADWFPRFDVPRYPDDYDEPPSNNSREATRLIEFALLVRPFPWSDDPRLPEFRDLVARLQLGHAEAELKSAPTQFIWDALSTHVRADRCMEGLIATHAYGLTQIANEIRRRLLEEEE